MLRMKLNLKHTVLCQSILFLQAGFCRCNEECCLLIVIGVIGGDGGEGQALLRSGWLCSDLLARVTLQESSVFGGEGLVLG